MTKLVVAGLVALLVHIISAQEDIEIELEGKFVTKHGGLTQEVEVKTVAELEKHMEKREAFFQPPVVLFNGVLRFRSASGARAIGINATVVVDDVSSVKDSESNRVKRDGGSNRKINLGLHCQFQIGEPQAQSVGVRLNLDINEISQEHIPIERDNYELKNSEMRRSEESFKFVGKLRSTDPNRGGFVNFAVQAGLMTKPTQADNKDDDERNKREAAKSAIIIDGNYTYEYTNPYYGKSTEVHSVTGEIIIEPLTPSHDSTPSQEFFADQRNVHQVLFETAGKVNVSAGGREIFELPAYTGILGKPTYSRGKRESSGTDHVLEVKYDGVFTEKLVPQPSFRVYRQRVSANFRFWELDETRN